MTLHILGVLSSSEKGVLMKYIRYIMSVPFWVMQGFFQQIADFGNWMAQECEIRGDKISGLNVD